MKTVSIVPQEFSARVFIEKGEWESRGSYRNLKNAAMRGRGNPIMRSECCSIKPLHACVAVELRQRTDGAYMDVFPCFKVVLL